MRSGVIAKYKFSNCGEVGNTGPNQTTADYYYKDTNVKVEIIGKGIQKWKAPQSGIYKIEAAGASGISTMEEYKPGKGAFLSSLFSLKENDVLFILVGQTSTFFESNWGGPGGGASFVVIENISSKYSFNTSIAVSFVSPLIVAAGGGGTGDQSFPDKMNKHGSDGISYYDGEGAGTSGELESTGGSGFATDDPKGKTKSFLNGGVGTNGGFGCGGTSWNVGGGGGGFKGGNGGYIVKGLNNGGSGGYGGTSFQSGFLLKNITGSNVGHGFVNIYLINDLFATCFLKREFICPNHAMLITLFTITLE